MGFRNVIGTLQQNGTDALGPQTLAYHYPIDEIRTGSLLTVESNHFAVLKSRGAILDVYETGQYEIKTPDHVVAGGLINGFFGNSSPWQFEALFVNRAKLILEVAGTAYSKEMAQMGYHVSCYVHVDTKDDALKLVQHLPFDGHVVSMKELSAYVAPEVEQSINKIVQLTELERVNERMPEIIDHIKDNLQKFIEVYGLTLHDVKAIIFPQDVRMKELISLRAFGLSEIDAVRYYTAIIMATRGIPSAPNMAVGQPYFIGNPQVTAYGDTVKQPDMDYNTGKYIPPNNK